MDLTAGRALDIDRRAIPEGAVESFWTAPDGQAIRRIDFGTAGAGPPRGALLFLPGRGDFYEKYLESLSEWRVRGWLVCALDWRGQAGSGRFGHGARIGHIDDLALWVADLEAFWRAWTGETPGPHVLVGHSMGGHLALRCVAEQRALPDALVLSVPMLGMAVMGLPNRLLHLVARAMTRLGDPRRAAWPESEKPGARPGDRMLLLTHDPARYADEAWWGENRPFLAMGPPSWRWVERALASIRGLDRPGVLEAVRVPVLLIGARADRLVSTRAIIRAARRIPRSELVLFGPEAAHEVLRETDPVRAQAMAAIDEFLDHAAPERHPAG